MKRYTVILILLLVNGFIYCQAKKGSGYQLSGSGFMENKGQIVDQDHKPNPDVKYLLCQPEFNVQLRKTGFSYDTYTVTHDSVKKENAAFIQRLNKFRHPMQNTMYHFHRVDVELLDCDTNAEITTEEKSSAYFNYFTEGVPQGGVSDVHYYQKVVYKNIYPHIDLAFYATDRGLKRPAEYEFIVHPGGKPADIKLRYKGAGHVSLNDNKLMVQIQGRELTESIPSSYLAGSMKPIEVNYTTLDSNTYGFSIVNSQFSILNSSSDLIIDPVPHLHWGTYYGGPDTGGGGTAGVAIALDSNNNVYITGGTNSFSGIATKGAYETSPFQGCSFIAKFNSTGSALLWGTYCGDEYGGTTGIALDPHNDVYVTGIAKGPTASIVTPGSYQPNYGGGYSDAFVDKFSPTGMALLWGTYYGGMDTEGAEGIVVDKAGNAYITGSTNSSSGIATAGAYQTNLSGLGDAFIAKFNSTGSTLVWATYYGGLVNTGGGSIDLDAGRNVYITGGTNSTSGIATAGAYQTVFGGGSQDADAFVAKFNAAGNSLLWGTYYGGSGSTGGVAMALDASDNVYITGPTTSSSGIATAGAYELFYSGGFEGDAFVAKFNATGSSLLWGTYYGGYGEDFGDGIAVDACGNSYITGFTNSSSGIVTPGAYQTHLGGGVGAAFVAKFNTTGSALIWGTYYAGGGRKGSTDQLGISYAIALDAQANVYVTGQTDTVAGVATPGAYLANYPNPTDDGYEAFVAKFDSTAPQFKVGLNPNNPTLCIGKSVRIDASGGTNYNWLPGTSLSCDTCPNPVATPTTTTTYTLTVNSNGCADTAHITITVVNPLTLAINAPPPIKCPGSPILLTASASGTPPGTYHWSPGGQTTDSVTVYPDSATIYTISVSNGCTTSKTDTVKPDNPALTACCDETIVLGDDTLITAAGNYIVKYKWQPSTGLSCDTCLSITVMPTTTTTYTVLGTDTMGCQVERYVTIVVEIPCTHLTIPNVFTPDYPGPLGINNVFYINTRDVDSWSVRIYDRWGKEMFRSANSTQSWDGTTESGGKAPDGVYYYIVNGTCHGTSFTKNGYLQLIR